jgi:hypothetical protein
MALTVEPEVTLQDIDEAIFHIRNLMKDSYGNRLTPRRRELLTASIDDLLDARLQITLHLAHEN